MLAQRAASGGSHHRQANQPGRLGETIVVRHERVDGTDLERRGEVDRVERLEPDRPDHCRPVRDGRVKFDEFDRIQHGVHPPGFVGNAGGSRRVSMAPTLLVSSRSVSMNQRCIAVEPGSSTMSFTRADASTYATPPTYQRSSSRICWRISDRVGAVGSDRRRRRRQVTKSASSGRDPAVGDHLIDLRQRGRAARSQLGDGEAALGYLERLTFLHAPQVDGQVLAKLPDTNSIWMLAFAHVAHGSTTVMGYRSRSSV